MFGGYLPETHDTVIQWLANREAIAANTFGANVTRQVLPSQLQNSNHPEAAPPHQQHHIQQQQQQQRHSDPTPTNLQAWISTDSRDKAGKSFFVGLFNFESTVGNQMVTATLPAAQCGSGVKTVKNLWSHEHEAVQRVAAVESNKVGDANKVARNIGPHDSMLLLVTC